MRKPNVTFEWQVLREGEELPPLSASAAKLLAPQPGRRRQRLVVFSGALCLLFVALCSAAWVKQQAEASLSEIQDELAEMVDADFWQDFHTTRMKSAPVGRDGAARDAAQWDAHDMQPQSDKPGKPFFSVEIQALQRDVAAVTVVSALTLTDGGPTTAYRQLRFFRRTDAGWQPTEPVATLWGQPQSLATAHFDVAYRSRDAQLVQAVAAELDTLYARMRENLGLLSTPPHRFTIEIIMGPVAGSPITRVNRVTHLRVSSPSLLPAPAWLTDAAMLRQSILIELVGMVIEEAASVHEIPPHWHTLLNSMRLWQLWDLGGPQTAWREPILRWFYADIQRLDGDALLRLPPAYVELCLLYSLWAGPPRQAGAALFCHELDHVEIYPVEEWQTLQFMDIVHIPASRFTLLPTYIISQERVHPDGAYNSVMRVALLNYITETFGHAQLSALWPILHEHTEWETLIPALFDMPVEEFVADWQAYLAAMNDK